MNNKDAICPVCEDYLFEFPDDYDICPNCGWENDGIQRSKRDYWGGANSLSANESRKVYILLQDNSTKAKVSEILRRHNEKRTEIYAKFRRIDHRTIEGERCRQEFERAHNEFVVELDSVWKAKENNKK